MLRFTIVFCLTAGGVALATAAQDAFLSFPAPTSLTRPWGICHWHGNAIGLGELEKETARWSEAGIGGYRIIPIYGVKGHEKENVRFMSLAFLDKLSGAEKIAAKHGMLIDMSFGAGWCFGGKTVPEALGVCALKVVKSGEDGPKGAKVLWSGADRRLVSYPTGQMVKRAQGLDAGPMLNPFSPAALDAHLELFRPLAGRPDAFPRATFHDSFEYFGAAWSEEFPNLFEKYRGYRIEDHLAALADVGDADEIARVKCDYRETLSDILVKETFPRWTAWCRVRGIETHNQAHGSPANLLEFYAIADTPETEMFGRGKRNCFASGFDARFREGDRSVLMSKFASSAAHLVGRQYVSAEAFTWMGEHFCETLEEMKAFGDLLFLSGVNRLYYHATTCSPDSAAWPGWLFYAASELNPRNPLWCDMKEVNSYFTRVQSLTSAATPDNDLLLFWPVYDQWMRKDGLVHVYSVHDRWLDNLPFGKLARRLASAGYQFDYVSDAFLSDEIVSRYKAIVIPKTDYMKKSTFSRLLDIGRRMPVVFETALPRSAPGLNGASIAQPEGVEPVADVISALAGSKVRRVDFATGETGLEAVRYRWLGGLLYFVVNTSMRPAKLALSGCKVLDPMNGKTSTTAEIGLAPAASIFVWCASDAYGSARSSVRYMVDDEDEKVVRHRVLPIDDWSLAFVRDVSGWEFPGTHMGDVVGDWTRFGKKEAEFSGTAVYSARFTLTDFETRENLVLDLGNVCHTARVNVNGQRIATLFMHPYQVEIAHEFLRAGVNALTIEVTNLAANRIRAYDRRGIAWKSFEDANVASCCRKGVLDAADWPVLQSGLMGPVMLRSRDARLPDFSACVEDE